MVKIKFYVFTVSMDYLIARQILVEISMLLGGIHVSTRIWWSKYAYMEINYESPTSAMVSP
jgi:hypothetical protein